MGQRINQSENEKNFGGCKIVKTLHFKTCGM